MQRWEYLTILLNQGTWEDSLGRRGTIPRVTTGYSSHWGDPAALLNELGQQGWDLVGVVAEQYLVRLFLKRPQE